MQCNKCQVTETQLTMSAYLRPPKSRASMQQWTFSPGLKNIRKYIKRSVCLAVCICGQHIRGEKDGWLWESENKSMHFFQMTSIKHYGRHKLLKTQHVYIICHVRVFTEPETRLLLSHLGVQTYIWCCDFTMFGPIAVKYRTKNFSFDISLQAADFCESHQNMLSVAKWTCSSIIFHLETIITLH